MLGEELERGATERVKKIKEGKSSKREHFKGEKVISMENIEETRLELSPFWGSAGLALGVVACEVISIPNLEKKEVIASVTGVSTEAGFPAMTQSSTNNGHGHDLKEYD